MKKTFLPEEFVEKFSRLMGEEKEEFFKFCKIKQRKWIWVNGLKIKPAELKERLEKQDWKLKQEKIHENLMLVEKSPQKPGQCEEFREGLFNLQELSSALPAVVLAVKENENILDCCAAPGNKTLQLSNLMNGKGKIIAVEKNRLRLKSLAFNIRKFGMKNVQAVNCDFLNFKTEEKFDKILLDAPCSSEGLVRKRFDALKGWTQKLVENKSKLQKKLIEKAFGLLKENELLVYSTCSLSPEEDEEVVSWLIEKNKNAVVEKINLKEIGGLKARNGLIEWNGKNFGKQVENCIRIYPQDNDCQAFFLAKIRKN